MMTTDNTATNRFLEGNPIRLDVKCGCVEKYGIYTALGIPPWKFRTMVRAMCDAGEMPDEYIRYRNKRALPIKLAEHIIRNLMPHTPDIVIEFQTPK